MHAILAAALVCDEYTIVRCSYHCHWPEALAAARHDFLDRGERCTSWLQAKAFQFVVAPRSDEQSIPVARSEPRASCIEETRRRLTCAGQHRQRARQFAVPTNVGMLSA